MRRSSATKTCEAAGVCWYFLVFFAVIALLPATAMAQAPDPSVLAGKSNEELRALATDPHNDILLRRSAATKLVITLADEGRFDDADVAGREFAKSIDSRTIKRIQAARRRSHVHVIALGTLALALGAAAMHLVRAHRRVSGAIVSVRPVAPLVAVFLLYAGGVGGYLASSYENGSAMPFVLFAAFMLPLVALLRVWSAVGSTRRAARVGRAIAAVASTFALAFLVVEHVNPAFLEGFGL